MEKIIEIKKDLEEDIKLINIPYEYICKTSGKL
jgi:hypothetical protein